MVEGDRRAHLKVCGVQAGLPRCVTDLLRDGCSLFCLPDVADEGCRLDILALDVRCGLGRSSSGGFGHSRDWGLSPLPAQTSVRLERCWLRMQGSGPRRMPRWKQQGSHTSGARSSPYPCGLPLEPQSLDDLLPVVSDGRSGACAVLWQVRVSKQDNRRRITAGISIPSLDKKTPSIYSVHGYMLT